MRTFILLFFTLFYSFAFAGLPPTTSKGKGDSSNITTFNFQFPNITVTHTGTTASFGVVNLAGGGTNNGSLAATAGGVLYTDGSKVVNVGAGTSGYVLTSQGSSAPVWQVAPTSSVITEISGVEKRWKFEYYTTSWGGACSGTCGTSPSLSNATLANTGSGSYNFQPNAGVCSTAVICSGNMTGASGPAVLFPISTAPTTTSFQFNTNVPGVGNQNSYGILDCSCY